MRMWATKLTAGCVYLIVAATVAVHGDGGQGAAEAIMHRYIESSFAKNLEGTLDLFQNRQATYFHINGTYYFTVDKDQGVFQIAAAKNYVDGWGNIQQAFSSYFATLVEALPVKTVVRTNGQGRRAPLDGGDPVDGETNYVILAKFYLDSQGNTGYAIVHGLDQFRVKHHKIANINNLEKTVFLSQEESVHLDSLPTNDARIIWTRNRTCELKNSIFASIDIEKRYDIELECP